MSARARCEKTSPNGPRMIWDRSQFSEAELGDGSLDDEAPRGWKVCDETPAYRLPYLPGEWYSSPLVMIRASDEEIERIAGEIVGAARRQGFAGADYQATEEDYEFAELQGASKHDLKRIAKRCTFIARREEAEGHDG